MIKIVTALLIAMSLAACAERPTPRGEVGAFLGSTGAEAQ
jgi:hypothetical protein